MDRALPNERARSGSLPGRSFGHLAQAGGVAGDVDLAVEMLRIAGEPGHLHVDQAEHDLRRADLGSERQRPSSGDVLKQIYRLAILAPAPGHQVSRVLQEG